MAEPKTRVTPEEFARYVTKFIGAIKCEVCGTQEWSLELDPRIDAGPTFTGETRKAPSPEGMALRSLERIPSCIVACKHCGNMKFFLREHVDTWLEANPNG